ncbi:hypothetical protein QZH41_015542, partial [Actinostola sp. cb2023]
KRNITPEDEEGLKMKEQAILSLSTLLSRTNKAEELGGLIKFIRPFLRLVSKAKAAKLVRTLVDCFLDMEASTGMEVELCQECIDWAKQEKRTFLRQALESDLYRSKHVECCVCEDRASCCDSKTRDLTHELFKWFLPQPSTRYTPSVTSFAMEVYDKQPHQWMIPWKYDWVSHLSWKGSYVLKTSMRSDDSFVVFLGNYTLVK